MVPQTRRQAVLAVRDALAAARPDQTAIFNVNAGAYLATIDALGQVPEQTRVLVTAHDAFSYFGREFGFEVMGIQGISTQSEAGLQPIGALLDILVARDIPAVLVETSVSDRNLRALIEGTAAQGHNVEIGGEL